MIRGTESYFSDLSASLSAFLQGNEVFTCAFSSEQSDFVRFNRALVRQAGQVQQSYLSLRLISGQRHATETISLSGDLELDLCKCRAAFADIREVLPDLPEDPLLTLNTSPVSTRSARTGSPTAADEMTQQVCEAAKGTDFVGFLARGPLFRGFASSLGQCNWHEVTSFNLEWSLYAHADKAIKQSYAGFDWEHGTFVERLGQGRRDLDILRQPARTLAPGTYRAYLAPAALSEIISMMTWGGFSEKARRTKQSPLQRLVEGTSALHDGFTLCENTEQGLAPAFTMDGFLRPARVPLITAGKNQNALVSARTAREYGLAQNGAENDAEAPLSVEVEAGQLPRDDVLKAIGTGLYINNLWYLNFSDRMNCRLTGMTRFATFWVENGQIVAPCNVMRFDDSVFRMLGSNLAGLTQERDFIPDPSTYHERVVLSHRLPGALLNEFTLTL